MSNFRDRFTSEVERIGVSKIANTLGIARNTIYNWMAKGNVPLNSLMGLNGMGADVGYIITGRHGALNEEGNYVLDDLEKVLLNSFRLCSLDAKKTIIKTSALVAAGVEETKKSHKFNVEGNVENQFENNYGGITIDKRGK